MCKGHSKLARISSHDSVHNPVESHWVQSEYSCCPQKNVCKSPMCLAEARARRSVVLRDSSFKSMDVTGSNGGCERALNTTSRPQGGTEGGCGGCNLLAPLRILTTSACLPIDCPHCGERNEAIAATYTFSVDGRDPLSSLHCRKRRTSYKEQVAGSI